MFVHVDFGVAFQLFCIVQGLTTAAYLLVSRPRLAGNKWLGLLIAALTLQVIDYFLSRSGIYYRNRWLYFTPLFFSWSFGPLLLAYVRSRYAPIQPLRWPHFLPVALQALFYLSIAVQSFDMKTWFWLTVHKPITRYIEHYGAVFSMLTYLVLVWRLVTAADPRSRWLRWGLLGLGAFYVVAALDPLVNAWYLSAGAPKFYLTSLVLPVLAYGLALLSWRQSQVGADIGILPTAVKPRLDSIAESVAPAVDPAQLARLVQALADEQLFKDPDLTLDRLAQHLGQTPNSVSQTINAGLQQSFSDLVNGYRLAEVKRRLLTSDAQRLTVLGLALEAGFNSKSTFNRVFKEKTGLTPKDYQKKYQNT